MTLPPFTCVTPPAFVVKLAAAIVPVNVVVPVLFNTIAASALVAPTVAILMLATPALIVSARAVLLLLSTVEVKVTAPFNITSAASCTLPLYNCEPVVVMLPFKLITPAPLFVKFMALNAVAPTTPLKVMLPVPALIVNARAVLLLSTVLAKLTALFVVDKVVSVTNCTASLYVCVPVVVIVPCNCVIPPLADVKLLIPVKLLEINVVPLKFSVKLLPLPVTLEVKLGVAPVNVTVAAFNDTAPV